MKSGLATTFSILSKTESESAVRILLPALDSTYPAIQDGALSALLSRRNPSGQGEILSRIPSMSQRWKYIIHQHAGRLTGTMRDAVLGSDEAMFQNACKAAVMFSEYDLIPTLLTVLEETSKSKVSTAAETLMQLFEQLYNEVTHPTENTSRRDPQWIHQHAVSCLETSVQRFGRHKRQEVIEAFLFLANSNNAVLNQILQNSRHVSYLVLVDVMSGSSHAGIMRLILDFLDNTQMPPAMLSVASNRCDLIFIRKLLNKIGQKPSDTVRQNLKRMGNIPWLQNYKNIVNNLDEACQHSLVILTMASGIARPQAFMVIEYILKHGKPGGRREATRALAAFNGAEANALLLRALNDSDPQVQANVLSQLRRRGIPGVLQRMVEKLDSPHLEVRQAARNALAEYSFQRFLGTFEMLDEEARKNTAAIVKKIDQQTIPLLRKELQSPVSSKQLRALQIARAMDVAYSIEDLAMDLLRDNDPVLRAEAAGALGKCPSPAVRKALEEALHDNNITVQKTARRSLDELS